MLQRVKFSLLLWFSLHIVGIRELRKRQVSINSRFCSNKVLWYIYLLQYTKSFLGGENHTRLVLTVDPPVWDITMCNPLKANRRFGRKCCLHLQGGRVGPEGGETYDLVI
jgi:hypothetical protein